MTLYKKLFKQTFVYGIATVVPRMLSFLLTPLYTAYLTPGEFGELSIVFAWIVFFNVVLAYGMETAFFRFFHREGEKGKVISTAAVSLIFSTLLFVIPASLFREDIAAVTHIGADYLSFVIGILALDALAVIPFSWIRAKERPGLYAVIKVSNVAVNLGLNIFFLVFLPKLSPGDEFFDAIFFPDSEVAYIFLSNLIASLLTLIGLIPFYLKIQYSFDIRLWKRMTRYASPILVAGIAFAVNEVLDKILLGWLLPDAIAESAVGAYAACYKLAIFMTLFATAFRMGIEPFFFSHASEQNAPRTYALVTRYFVVLGGSILLLVTIFSDFLKILLIRDASYWDAMVVVPLILVANFFLGIYHNLSVWYKISDRTHFAAWISLAGAMATLLLNFWLIPKWSYLGSAIATISAYGIMMMLSFFLGRKFYPIPYDLRRIGSYLVLSIGFSVVHFYVFRNNYYIGSILILIFFALVYYAEKDQFRQFYNQKPTSGSELERIE